MRAVYIETTANPAVIKFIANYQLIPGSLELDRNSDYKELPLVQQLFRLPYVEKVFVTSNFVAVSKNEQASWEDVSEEVRALIEKSLSLIPNLYRQKKEKNFPLFADATPNPNVMKFVSLKPIIEGFIEVDRTGELEKIPLAKEIFESFSYTTKVFISDNFVAVTKDESVAWHQVMTEVKDLIATFLQEKRAVCNTKPHQHEAPVENIINRDYSADEQKISQILEKFVAPAIGRDGGKISLVNYDEATKTAQMLLQGACSGCPSSTRTLKNGIENILKRHIPELVEKVEAVNG